jgi:hypothetical protein
MTLKTTPAADEYVIPEAARRYAQQALEAWEAWS